MKNIFFDVCAIPIYLLILWTCHVRRFTEGRANRTFIALTCMSLASAVADLWMEFVVNPVPLSPGAVALGTALSYVYKFLRNGSLVVYFVYIFTTTRTEYRLQTLRSRLLLWLPNTILLITLLQNFFTHNVFVITAEGGYARGPMLAVFYVISFVYAIAGSTYCAYCRRYLITSKWVALLSVYGLTFIGVVVQLVKPHYAVEMFCTALGLLLILLVIVRPEESLGGKGVIRGWTAYVDTLDRVLGIQKPFQVVVMQITNAAEIRGYIGDREFQNSIEIIADEINNLYSGLRLHIDLFFENPGTFYLILDDDKLDISSLAPGFNAAVARRTERYAEQGVHFDGKYCIMKCPEDLKDCREIIQLGHLFTQLGTQEESIYKAGELVHTRDYALLNHMKDILNRAITQGTLEMYYQPIYDIQEGRFRSAEALARIRDTEFGMISPGYFIPAAEKSGLILPMGERILESVYRFISEHDLKALGLSYVEINLSVAQCLQRDLPDIIRRLQEKYGIDPHQINFEITETLFGNLNTVMEKNVLELVEMGYTFSLDDYGTGYSNIQRLSKLPLHIIKIDKSLVDDMFTENGKVIIENTVRMMKGIHKALVVEGVETGDAVDTCKQLSCDYIQGYYYSKPLPAEEFVRFLEKHD